MATRAAAKRNADVLGKSSTSGSLKRKRAPTKSKIAQDAPISPWDLLPRNLVKATKDEAGGVKHEESQDAPLSVHKAFSKTKRAPPKSKTAQEPNVGQWDVLPHNLGTVTKAKTGSVKTEEPQDETSSTNKASRKKKNVIDTSDDVLDKVAGLIAISEDIPKTKLPKSKTYDRYGLTPGKTPFPHHLKPTKDDCEEVARLLGEFHGMVKAPERVPPPSMDRAGCGEVPDLLDALMRTRLSASTTSNNATLALTGLKETFGKRRSEDGTELDTPDWEAVHKADLQSVIDAIKSGGLAKSKGTDMKNILDMVHQENCRRRDALVKEKKTGEPANIPGAKDETEDQKEAEILGANASLLSMDYVFDITDDHEAMKELVKLPGIGVKTASCVMLFCMQRASFAVDTHVWRHCKWLGWVPPTAKRDQTFSHLDFKIPPHLKYPLHQYFLKHGKTCYRCKAGTSVGSQEWNNTLCPIEHLVNRYEEKKQPRYFAGKKGDKGKGKKGVSDEESDVEIGDGDYE
jgi:endonuclease III